MDKLIHEGSEVTVTNDGATVMKLLNVVHPAAKILVDIAKSQDDEASPKAFIDVFVTASQC